MLAIYDLFDSTTDLKSLGSSSLNTIFGINGLLDALDDVREFLSTQYMRSDGKIKTRLSRSGLGKITSKIPVDVRKGFVRIINNPVVQGITFITLAVQLGFSIDGIVKGENVELNSYFATSSGIKLASMSTSFGIRGATSFGVKTTSIGLRGALPVAKVLGKLSIATLVIDIVVAIAMDINQGLEYTKMIASHIPLSGYQKFSLTVEKSGIAGILCYLNPPCLIAYLLEKTKSGEEYEKDIRLKQYLDLVKEKAIKWLNEDHDTVAVVQHVVNIKENYSEIIKVNRMQLAGNQDICGINENYYDIDFLIGSNTQNDLSLLNTNEFLNIVEHDLDPLEAIESARKCHWHFYPTPVVVRKSRGIKVTNCRDIIQKIYTPSISFKHFPYLNYTEYNRDKIRFLKAPFGTIDVVKECGKQIFPLQKTGNFSSKSGICNVGKIHRNCTRTFTITGGNIEPFVLTKIGNNQEGKVVYLPGPKILKAAVNYPAVMYVPEGNVDYTGSRNHDNVFIINSNTQGTFRGGNANNVVVKNYDNNGKITVDLHNGIIAKEGNINLINIYNYVSNSTAQQSITTSCDTRYVSAGGGSRGNTIRQANANCKDEDNEVRVVHKNDVHYGGSKQAIFVVNRNSNNATIIVGNVNKNITNIIRLEGLGIERLRIKEAEGYYNLTLLTDDGQATSVKVVNGLKNLAIYTEGNQTIFVQGKFLNDIMGDMQYQRLNHSGKYVDDRILENSKTESKAVIFQEIDYTESTSKSARDIADKSNNLGIPAQVMVTKHHEKELIEKAIMHDTSSKDIYVDLFASGDFKLGYPFYYLEGIKKKDENTTIFSFLDGSRVHLNSNGHNIIAYEFHKAKYFSDIVAGYYQDIVNELNTTIPIKYYNQVVVIGTKRDDVLHNYPNYTTHLIGNGGKNRYVIGMNSNDLSIPGVTIYDFNGFVIDISDLRKKFGANLDLEPWSGENGNINYDLLTDGRVFLKIYTKQCSVKNGSVSRSSRNIFFTCDFNQELLRITRENISSALSYDNYDPLKDLKSLINNYADISAQDDQGNTPLHFACKNCNYDVVKYFIEEKNASINVKNKDGKTPLELANKCQQSKKERIVKLFRKAQSELDKQLLSAARDGDLAKVRSFVSKGADVNAQDTQNQYGDTWTSLHHASRNGHLEVARYLIENCAGINVKNSRDKTPLHEASWHGHLDIVKYFVKNGADISIKDEDGNTSLDFAKKRDRSNIVEYLEKIKEDRERPIQRPRRSIETKNDEVGKEENFKMEREEVQAAASSATKPSSWISDSFGLIKTFIGGLIGLSSSVKEISNATPQSEFKKDVPNSTTPFDSTGTKQESDYTGWNFLQNLFQGFVQDNVNYVDENLKQAHRRQMPIKFEPKSDPILEMGGHYISQVDGNGALQLFDMFIKKVKGTNPPSFRSNHISESVAQGYALDTVTVFGEVIKLSASKIGVSVKQLKYNSAKMYTEVEGKIISGKLKEIPEVLKSYAAKALPQKLGNSHLSKFKIEFDKEIDAKLGPLMQQATFSNNSTSIDNKQCSTNNTVNQSSIFKRIVDKNSSIRSGER